MKTNKKIALLCDYRLMPERIGGMDRFFWLFDGECKALDYEIVWFFPNESYHDGYVNLYIIAANGKSIEQTFLEYSQHFDIVFTHFLELCTPFYKAVKKQTLASKVITVDHNPRPFGGYPLKKKIQKRIKGFLYSRYIDLFVGVSQYTVSETLKDFGKHIKNRTQLVYNGIMYQKFKKRTARNFQNPTFLVVCHLRYSKGIQDLIKAVALLPAYLQKEIKIDLYGNGPYKDEIVKLIYLNGIENVFCFKGSVSNIFEVYHNYDFLIHPSHEETFCYSVIESLLSNVPVITTKSPGGNVLLKVQHGINGYLFNIKDYVTLSKIIENIFNGEYIISNNISNIVYSEFSIEQMVENYIKLID